MNEEYLTVKNVASKLNVKPVTVYKWLREGKFKGTFFKLGGVYKFGRQLLEKHLEDMMNDD